MKLTKEQREKIDSFIRNKCALPPICPICHKNSWSISPEVFELRAFHGGSMVIGGKSGIVPLILVTCANCVAIPYLLMLSLQGWSLREAQ